MRERSEYLDRLLPGAISALATEEFDRLIDRCVLRLKGIEASGLNDGDFLARDLWEEYCYETQDGPRELSSVPDPATAWSDITRKIAEEELQACSPALRTIMASRSSFLGHCGTGDPDAVRDEEILAEVTQGLATRAARCNLDLLGDDRFEQLMKCLSEDGKSICWKTIQDSYVGESSAGWATDIDSLLDPQGDLSILAAELAAAAISEVLFEEADQSMAYSFLQEHAEVVTDWLAEHDAMPFLSRVQARIAADRQEAGLR